MNTINSSSISWEFFPHKDGSITYCADGDGFVSLEMQINEVGSLWFTLNDQGDPIADLDDMSLSEALEIAQNYLAATYNDIFKDLSYQFQCDKHVKEALDKIGFYK